MLMEGGADLETKDGKNEMPLLSHSDRRSRYSLYRPSSIDKIIEFLLEKRVDCDVKDNHNYTALELAIGRGDCCLQIFKLLLQSCSDELPSDVVSSVHVSGITTNRKSRSFKSSCPLAFL